MCLLIGHATEKIRIFKRVFFDMVYTKMLRRRRRSTSYSPTISRICVSSSIMVTRRAYARCKSTVLKRDRVADQDHHHRQEKAPPPPSASKLRAEIESEKQALEVFEKCTPVVESTNNVVRAHQLRKNERLIRSRRIKHLEAQLTQVLSQSARVQDSVEVHELQAALRQEAAALHEEKAALVSRVQRLEKQLEHALPQPQPQPPMPQPPQPEPQPQPADDKVVLQLESKIRKMSAHIKDMEEKFVLTGDAAHAAKLVLKLRAQLKLANVEEMEWDFTAEGAYEEAMAEHAKLTAWLEAAAPQVTAADKKAYFENEKMQDTWLNRAMMTPRYAEIMRDQKETWRIQNLEENTAALNFIRMCREEERQCWPSRFKEERGRMFRFVCSRDSDQLSKAHPSDFMNVVPNKPDARELRALYMVLTTIKFKNEARALNLAEEVYNLLKSSKMIRSEYSSFSKTTSSTTTDVPPRAAASAASLKAGAPPPKMGNLMAELKLGLKRRASVEEAAQPVRTDPPVTRRASSAMFSELQSKLLAKGPFAKKDE